VTVEVAAPKSKFGSESVLNYESLVAFDLGTQTALTLYDGEQFAEVNNPRFTQKAAGKIKAKSKALRRKRAPNRKKKIKASRRWKKARKQISKLQRKVANQRKDWQHKVTSDIASRYDIGVTEQLNTKRMTRQGKKGSRRQKQKAGLNKSILSVCFGTINQMIAYKIESKGGLMLMLNTRKIKPSQRCPNCGQVHKNWANLSNRYHVCDDCGFEIPRDQGSVMVMYNVALNQQPGLGTSLVDCGCFSSTDSTGKRKHTGSMKQLGQKKRQKSQFKKVGRLETPDSYESE
jgi:putative transposase